jgi:tetratricopeptide (TPR) repeat protein
MTDSRSLFTQATSAAKQKDFATARSLLKQILKQDPNNLDAWLLAAHVVESRSDAINCLKRVLRLDPGHAYARQKLAQLQGASPAPKPAGPSKPAPAAPQAQTPVPANQTPAARPAAPSPQAAKGPQQAAPKAPAGSSSKLRTGMIGLGVGLLAVVCLVGLVVAALSPEGSLLGNAPPTPTNAQLFNVIYQNAQAGNAKNLDAYMDTIHPNSPAYHQTRSTLEEMFAQYDLYFQFYNLEVTSLKSNEAEIHFQLLTRKLRGPAFRDNVVTGTMTLRPDNGTWKIYRQKIEDVQY